MLPSGLPEEVADSEPLARFLTSSGHFNAQMAKPSAFLPSPQDQETSVFRHGAVPEADLWAIGDIHVAGNRRIHGAAIVKASDVRAVALSVIAHEPPPRHAAIRDWPLDSDPALQKAKQKKHAALVASKAALVQR